MRSADIKPRTWYANVTNFGGPAPNLVLGIERYTSKLDRYGTGHHMLTRTPDAPLSSGQSWSNRNLTGFLAITLVGAARDRMRSWALSGADPATQPADVDDAIALLDDLMKLAAVGPVDLAEAVKAAGVGERMDVTIMQPREIDREYVEAAVARRDAKLRTEQAARQRREEEEARREFLVEALTKAKKLGLKIGFENGGVEETNSSQRFSRVQMPAAHYAELVDEIARLRDLVAKTITADENGESGA
jgi:hypothetical protein